MGSKSSKKNPDGTPIKVPPKAATKLSSKDYKFITQHTGLAKDQIDQIFADFNANNPDGKLNKQEFMRLYDKLRPEPIELLDEISNNVFEAFDKDENGMIDFQEFIVAYALTSRGDLKTKLDYAFDVYDADENGSLTSVEVRAVIHGMLDLLGADKKGHDEKAISEDAIRTLDANRDGRITKEEFVKGLLSNFALRQLMSPFD